MKPDPALVAAMEACVKHARDLFDSSKAVEEKGHPNIAYHLAALALEELGRRELLGVQWVAAKAKVPPSWPTKNTQDHVKKLFWCFFGAGFFSEKITQLRLDEMKGLAQHIHETRLAGLYVDQGEDGLSIPSDAIKAEEASRLIGLAEARLAYAETAKLRDEISQEEADQQAWFLAATDDPEKRKQVLSGGSLTKLAELKDAGAWVKWLKDLFDKAEAEGQEAARLELERSRNLPNVGTKDKWRLRVRILCASHSIRANVLNDWNKQTPWIALTAGKKNEVIIDFTLKDNVPIDALWYFGWGLARHFVVALNIGTMGFWWWHMPEHINRFYESIHDLESGKELALERVPSLKIDWGENRVFTKEDLARVAAVFVALPGPNRRDQHEAYNYYIGGLTFLSLNDIHWQCEVQSFGNFFKSLQAMMAEQGDWKPSEPFEPSFSRFLAELFPRMEEGERFAEICRGFEKNEPDGLKITLKEVCFIKLFCDAYFLAKIQPKALKAVQERLEAEESDAPTAP